MLDKDILGKEVSSFIKYYIILHELVHILCSKKIYRIYGKKVEDSPDSIEASPDSIEAKMEEIIADLFALHASCKKHQNSPENFQNRSPYLNHQEWNEYRKKYLFQLQ